MNPSTTPGVERVVVVFPATLDSGVDTFDNVFIYVYRAVQE